MQVAMIGTGYVGLVSGACFSEFGHQVVCVDKDAQKIADLMAGNIPIFEPGLDALVEHNVASGRLIFSTDLVAAVSSAEAVFIAVGTPSRRGDGHADLSYVYEAAAELAVALDGPTVVITKSTVPVGTGREVERIIRNTRPDADFDIASNPEFLREGSAIEDFMRPNRVVVGAETDRARKVLREIYRPLFLLETPVLFTSLETAELVKYAANAFLATKITFINEIADLCEAVGANVQDVTRGIGLDGRIGPKFLHAGPGYGGSCFPKDTMALLRTAEIHDIEQRVIEAVVQVNARRKRSMSNRVIAACGGSVLDKTIALLGLTFKPNTDDMRESPSIDIVRGLQDGGARVRAFDPQGMEAAAAIMENVEFASGVYQAIDGADALVIVTEWNQFRALDLKRVMSLLKTPVFMDLRNIYRRDEMIEAGFDYHCIGKVPLSRPPTLQATTLSKS